MRTTRPPRLLPPLLLGSLVTALPPAWAEPAAEDDAEITIRRIKLVLDGEVYSYTGGAVDRIPEWPTQPETILSFLTFRPGDRITPEDLDAVAADAQARLATSGFFYQAKVIVIPPRKYPKRRTVVVEVREGFRFRYGGGSLFGVFGMDNVLGLRKRFFLVAGYNVAGVEYLDRLVLGAPVELGARLLHTQDLWFEERDWPHRSTMSSPTWRRSSSSRCSSAWW